MLLAILSLPLPLPITSSPLPGMTIPTASSSGSAPSPSPTSLPLLSPTPAVCPATGTRRVLVVGGGPAGVVTLRNLREDESAKGGLPGLDAVLYERRESIGGVWYLDEETLRLEAKSGYSRQWPVPSTSHPRFPSPAYRQLIGNLFTRFLTFSGQPWDPLPDGEIFPTLEETFRYVQKAAAPLKQHTRTKHEVKGVWELPPLSSTDAHGLATSGGWLVHTHDHSTTPPRSLYEHFSAISLCPSYTTHPNIPSIPGIAKAMRLAPGKIHHAKWYRTVDPWWASKRVVVVGNGVSSNDIVAHLVLRRKEERGEVMGPDEEHVYRAIRHPADSMFPALDDDRIMEKPFVAEVHVRTVEGRQDAVMDLVLATGEKMEDVDHLILGTGYQGGVFDWVHPLARPTTAQDVRELEQKGIRLGHDGWTIDAESLESSEAGGAQLADGLEDLWIDLTPPPSYPVEEGSKSAVASKATRNVAQLSGEDIDIAYPRRVPHLHSHILSARNPTLAIGSLIASVVPFVLADLVSRYTRLVWETALGSSTAQPPLLSPTSFEERRCDELARHTFLIQRSESAPTPTPLRLLNAPPGAPTFSSVPVTSKPRPFHNLGGDQEYIWQLRLRTALLERKPWLRGLVGLSDEDWDAGRDDARKGMYGRKLEWLKEREEKRKKAVEEQLRSAGSVNGANGH